MTTRLNPTTDRRRETGRRFDAGDGLAVLACALAATTTVLGVGMADARADADAARADLAAVRDDAGVWAPGDAVPADVPGDARVYEDGSWVAGDRTGCIPGALCDDDPAADESDDPEDVARGVARMSTWEGFTVGEVIVCPVGWTASVDTDDTGRQWAACM